MPGYGGGEETREWRTYITEFVVRNVRDELTDINTS
jgi:hypothetical protein